ncbi:PilZ domain-containing protein [Hydrogenovibrio halophilus]|uniref:PilZ domain-containing protein n=1 Tax=Hydrogenovibrio halophilus TaxID=373391 RepID=UPI000380733F|nr:PilZ domain-containing protein [Hydrogenovibrio halophilus]
MNSQNSRSFYRIDVMLPCSYRIISAESAEQNPIPAHPDANYIERYFLEDFGELEQQIQDVIGEIGQKSALVATALSALNNKINFMLQTIDQKQLVAAIPQRMVNLSAGGMAFQVQDEVQKTDMVDLLLQPLADEAPILVRAKIVKIIPESKNPSSKTIALEYIHMTEEDRRKLVYFIQSKEIEYAHNDGNTGTR